MAENKILFVLGSKVYDLETKTSSIAGLRQVINAFALSIRDGFEERSKDNRSIGFLQNDIA